MRPAKRILVILRREPTHAKTAQGLRTAVAYAAAGLELTVALCGAARALIEPSGTGPAQAAGPLIARHLATLRALEKPVLLVTAEELCTLAQRADAVTTW